MIISDLMHSLTLGGFSLTVGSQKEIQVKGPTASLTDEQKQALTDNKDAIIALLTFCIPDDERMERETIQFADTPEVQPVLARVIAECDEMTNADHLRWIVKRINERDSSEALEALALRFDTDIERYETFHPVQTEVLERIAQRRAWLKSQTVYTQNTNEQDASTSCPF